MRNDLFSSFREIVTHNYEVVLIKRSKCMLRSPEQGELRVSLTTKTVGQYLNF